MAWRTWNTWRFQNVSHWSQSPGWTEGVSPPWLSIQGRGSRSLLSCTLCELIIFLTPVLPPPRCSICSMPGPGGGNPSIHFSYIHQVQPCLSTLPNLTSSRPPLGIPPRTRLGGDSWHRPYIPVNIHPLLSGQVLFPLCQGLFYSGY